MKPRRGATNSTRRVATTVRDVCAAMDEIAPPALAQGWDNVGLIAGDLDAKARRVLLAIDLTDAVVREALAKKADVIVAYHPPIFKPIANLRAPGTSMDALVFRCIRAGIAIYSPHTALDAATGGTNDVLLDLCGVSEAKPLEYATSAVTTEFKLVVFVPGGDVEKVSQAMFAAGAGRIGDYTQCSFRIPGEGTFLGGESTKPTIGQRGKLETTDEFRLEVVVPAKRLPEVVAAMRATHSYEEPAFDLYPLANKPAAGIGRIGKLTQPTTLSKLARKLAAATRADAVQIVGRSAQKLTHVVTVAGAAGSLPFKVRLTPAHAIITGEIRHHDALTIHRIGCAAIALGHWASERPVLASVAKRLAERLGIATRVSTADVPSLLGV